MNARELKLYDIKSLYEVSRLISLCGEDMFRKYNLKHWKNSTLKTFLILIYSSIRLKRKTISIYDGNTLLATYQYNLNNKSFCFGKFAVSPNISGRGIGSKCLDLMKEKARSLNCKFIECEVYDKSEHALQFYLKRGFIIKGEMNTLKYRELKLIKNIEN